MNLRFAILTLGLLIAGAGCTKFPYGASFDRHNFVSTPSRPLTISVEDALTREELLRVDVPVGKKLVVDFDHETDWAAGPSSSMPAEEVRWQVLPPGDTLSGSLRNKMRLSGNPVRLRVTTREPQSMEDLAEPDYQPGGAEAAEPSGPTYQPNGAEESGGDGSPAGRTDQAGPAANGDQIAPKRGPATREAVDRPAEPSGGNDSADQPSDEAEGAATPADLEDALEANEGPTYQPAGPNRESGAPEAEDDGTSPLGASG